MNTVPMVKPDTELSLPTTYAKDVPIISKTKLDLYGIDAILEQIAHGVTLKQFTQELGVPRHHLILWLQLYHSERYRHARTAAATAYADDATHILDSLDNEPIEEITAARVALARARATHRMLLASLNDRANFHPDAPANATPVKTAPVFNITFVRPAAASPHVTITPDGAIIADE